MLCVSASHRQGPELTVRSHGGAAKHRFRGAIEQHDALVLVDRDNGVHRGVDDAGQTLLTTAQRLLRTSAGTIAIAI